MKIQDSFFCWGKLPYFKTLGAVVWVGKIKRSAKNNHQTDNWGRVFDVHLIPWTFIGNLMDSVFRETGSWFLYLNSFNFKESKRLLDPLNRKIKVTFERAMLLNFMQLVLYKIRVGQFLSQDFVMSSKCGKKEASIRKFILGKTFFIKIT